MELTFYGSNCFKLTAKDISLVIDDTLAEEGGVSVINDKDTAIFTQVRMNDNRNQAKLTIDMPGEYELSDVTVIGVQTAAHTDNEDEKSATIYKLIVGGYQIVFLGHIAASLSSEVLEKIGAVDILVVPIGGHGYTLEPEEAADVVKMFETKVIIPSHYDMKGVNYPVPQAPLDEFLEKMAANDVPHDKSLKLKGELVPGILVLDKQ